MTILLLAVWNLVVFAAVLAGGANPRGWLALTVAAIVLTMGVGFLRRKWMGLDRVGELTGATLSPTYVLVDGLLQELPKRAHWTGAASIPTWLGRIEAPLASLEITQETTTLRVRPRIAATVFGAYPLTVRPDELELVFPVAARFRKGVALKLPASPLYYFWTSETAAVLTACHASNFPVDWAERKRVR